MERVRPQGEEDATLRVVGALSRRGIGAPIVNQARGGDHYPSAALLDALHMAELPAHGLPQTPEVGSVSAEGLAASFKNG